VSETRPDSLRIPVLGGVRVRPLYKRRERLPHRAETDGSRDGVVRVVLLAAEESRNGGGGPGGALGARARRGEAAHHLVFESGEERLLVFHLSE